MSYLQLEHSQGPQGLGVVPLITALVGVTGQVATPLLEEAKAQAEAQAELEREIERTRAEVDAMKTTTEGPVWPWAVGAALLGGLGYVAWSKRRRR